MPVGTYDADLTVAHAVADACDAVTLARFRALDLVVTAKPDTTPVSDADTSAERAARTLLGRERPRDAVHGEEYADTGSGPRRWVLDPIDGTKNYVRGVPVWATLVALLDAEGRAPGSEVVVAVVSAPALGRRWWATEGGGAWAVPTTPRAGADAGAVARAGGGEASRLHVSGVARLADASVSYSDLEAGEWGARRAAWLDVLDGAWRTRAYGDFWSYALLAEGAVDVAAEPVVELHDLAALDLLVREAGGRFTDLTGRPGPGHGSALATNSLLHEEVVARLERRRG